MLHSAALKGSYDAILLFLWISTSCLCIDKVPWVADFSLKTKEIFFIKVKTLPRPPKTPNLNNLPPTSTSWCGEICKILPKCIRKEKRWNYYSRCSFDMSWRRCVSLWRFTKEDRTRNQWLSCIYNTVPEQFNPNIRAVFPTHRCPERLKGNAGVKALIYDG